MHDMKKPKIVAEREKAEELDFNWFGAVPLVENLYAPDTYATEATFFAVNGDAISITLVSQRCDTAATPPHLANVVIGRLVMPIAGARGLAAGLYDFLCKAGHPPIMTPADAGEIQ